MSEISRRRFLSFMGRSAAAAATLPYLSSCVTTPAPQIPLPFQPLSATAEDTLKLAEGFRYGLLLNWRQPLNSKGDLFGFNNDYIAYRPLNPAQPNEGLMWVNHEYHDPFFNSGWRPGSPRTAEQIQIERKEVGGSIVHIKRLEDRWQMVENSPYNRRLNSFTEIPLVCERPILGRKLAIGTLANCAGGVTPWGTVLSCEENFDNFIGDVEFKDGARTVTCGDEYLSWTEFAKLPPEHYGWVVEVDLKTGNAKKLCAMGRFSHECATCTLAADGRTVVYMGDDTDNEHIYKFISRRPGSLEQGELYVADVVRGRWLHLSRKANKDLRTVFRDHTELLIRTREAAKMVGATPMDRPEDIEIDPHTKHVIVALTNNKRAGNHFGSLFKIIEKDNDPLSLEFRSETFLAGGPSAGFACPDNLAFDPRGNLWMCTDISGSGLKAGEYAPFGNNGLFFIPLQGPFAGRPLQVASAPNGAEFTGPCFSPDGRSLFLSVQHPGERMHVRPAMASTWPNGSPSPCVVTIEGPTMDRLMTG